ncbi:hypothetical protein [Methanoculleus sp.]|nr:hypothetical protein [Methanoculleus sp.]
MDGVSVAELLIEVLDDEKKARVLNLISNGLYGENLLEQLLDPHEGE